MVGAFFGSGGPACGAIGAHRTRDTPNPEDTFVQPLSASQWRVIDRRWPESDAFSLLGFIEETHQEFEVMQLHQGFQRFTFTSLADALNHFSDSKHLHDVHADR